jgi:hypothetical protein
VKTGSVNPEIIHLKLSSPRSETKKIEQRDTRDTIKWADTHIMEIPEEEERKKT